MNKYEILGELFWELHDYRNGHCSLERLVTGVWDKAYYTGQQDMDTSEAWDDGYSEAVRKAIEAIEDIK